MLPNPFESLSDQLKEIQQNQAIILQLLSSNHTLALSSTTTGYLSRKEVAKRYQISLVTLNSYTRSGKVLGYRIGRRVLYKPAEIESALAPIKTKGRAAK